MENVIYDRRFVKKSTETTPEFLQYLVLTREVNGFLLVRQSYVDGASGDPEVLLWEPTHYCPPSSIRDYQNRAIEKTIEIAARMADKFGEQVERATS